MLALTPDHREAEQQHWRYSDEKRAEEASWDAERSYEFRLAQAQSDERREFQQEAGAVEQNIDRDEALEAEPEAHRPASRQDSDGDPRRAGFGVQLAKNAGQHAVLRHGKGQSGIAHD